MSKPPKDDEYEGEEAQRRFEEALKGGLKTPPQPLKEKAPTKPPKAKR